MNDFFQISELENADESTKSTMHAKQGLDIQRQEQRLFQNYANVNIYLPNDDDKYKSIHKNFSKNGPIYSGAQAYDYSSNYQFMEAMETDYIETMKVTMKQECVQEEEEEENLQSECIPSQKQQASFIHINNGICKISNQVKKSYEKDTLMSKLNTYVQRCATEKNINLEESRCYFDKSTKMFILYDNRSSLFNFFDIQNEDNFRNVQIPFKLEEDQIFCIKETNILYISRKVEDFVMIDAFKFDLDEKQIELELESEHRIENTGIIYMYYKDNELEYLFQEPEDDEYIYYKGESLGFVHFIYDAYNNYLAIADDQLVFNGQPIYNEKYRDTIDSIIQYFSDKHNKKSLCTFKSKEKYEGNYQLSINFDYSQSNQISCFKLPFQFNE